MCKKSLHFRQVRISSALGALLLTLSLLLPLCPVYAAEGESGEPSPPFDSIWSGEVADGFASGSGSRYDPYLIDTPDRLAHLAERVNSGDDCSGEYFQLTDDLYLNDITHFNDWRSEPPLNEWTPIGGYTALSVKDKNDYSEALETHGTLYLRSENGYTPADRYIENAVFYHFATFNGYFDGNGYGIYGLYLSTEQPCAGLFGACKDATLIDLTLSAAYISGINEAGGLIGHLEAETGAQIQNCYVDADIFAAGDRIGGLVGSFTSRSDEADLSITDSTAFGNLTASDMAGGMVGEALYTLGAGTLQIEDCTNLTYISAESAVGGMIGRLALPASLVSCKNEAALSANSNVGGIVGEIYSEVGYVTVSECRNSAALVGQNAVGGIVGLCSARPLEDSTPDSNENSGDVLVELLGSVNLGALFGAQSAGGIAGICTTAAGAKMDLTGCKNSASVSGKNQIGGIVGHLNAEGGQLTVGSCENYGAVTADTLAGGIVGNACTAAKLTLYQCFSYAAITAKGDCAGGIAGQISASDHGSLLLELSCSNGSVKSTKYAGGIVGNQSVEHASASAKITNCFSNALLTAEENAGGITGAMEALSGQLLISNSLFFGSFTSGNKLTGGISAYAHAKNPDAIVQINYSYYHQSAASRPALLYGGKGSELCQTANGLGEDDLRGSGSLVGIDFTSIWQTGNEENLYPTLREVPFVWENYLYTVTGKSATLLAYLGRSDIAVIPAKLGGMSVTTVDDSAFEGSTVVEVVLPDSVTTIGESAFADCKNLRSITLSSALRAVGAGAFKNCDALETRRSATPLTDLYTGSDNHPFDTLPITLPVSMQAEFVYENGVSAAQSSSFTSYEGDYYLIDAPSIVGYEADVSTLTGICRGSEKLRVVYRLGSYQLTIRYLYPDGSEAAPNYNAAYHFGEAYSVLSPEVSGHIPANAVLEGLMEGKDLLFTVYYSAQFIDPEPEPSTNRSLLIILLICASFALICCIAYFIFRYRSNHRKEESDFDFDTLFKPRF